ncbi:hypothetical protein [Thermodesulfitimonas autotrophica]|uniref:hypothetical protein n=1 Tax=Thermodesulfitimonas autotrophica TaxID=1894989 RepID=UPI000F4E2386|nr:hypothetical protein [Thermodesulfitimonas autotrophica]
MEAVRSLTLGFGPHRVEMLDVMEEEMRRHKVVILEEPAHPDFYRLLAGKAGIRRYLVSGTFQFPRFVLRACRRYQQLYAKEQIAFFQADPYVAVAQSLAAGRPPSTEMEEKVWECEHGAARALLTYYEAVANNNFDAMVKATLSFARTDAHRIRLREELRAEEIFRIVQRTEGDVYVEAGYIHLYLYPLLKQKAAPQVRPRICFLLQEAIRGRSNLPWRQHLSPGDVLTLRYINGKRERPGDLLLAAQSLIYVSLVSKEEKLPSPTDPFPHLSEELYLCRWVRRLSYAECGEFYRQLRTQGAQK